MVSHAFWTLWICPARILAMGVAAGTVVGLGLFALDQLWHRARADAGLPALTARAAVLAVVMGLAAMMLVPDFAQAADGGAAGCSGTALTTITGLDNLLATIWGYLMGGAVTKVLAAALFIYGLFGLFERRATPLVFGFSGAFIAAFAPTIIKAIFSGAQTGTATLCG